MVHESVGRYYGIISAGNSVAACLILPLNNELLSRSLVCVLKFEEAAETVTLKPGC